MAKLTEMQRDLMPQLVAGYLQRQQQDGIKNLVGVLSEASAGKVYDLVEGDFQMVLRAQQKQLEEAKNGT